MEDLYEKIVRLVGNLLVDNKVNSIEKLNSRITNASYKVTTTNKDDEEEVLLVRLNTKMEGIIDRSEEKFYLRMFSNAPSDYLAIEEDYMIVKFKTNSRVLELPDLDNSSIMDQLDRVLNRVHESDPSAFNKVFDPLSYIDIYRSEILPHVANSSLAEDAIRNLDRTLEQMRDLWVLFQHLYGSVPSHNDLVPSNLLIDSRGVLELIDWEYAGLNNRYWDIASLFLEVLGNYDAGKVYYKESSYTPLLINMIMQDYLWSYWTVWYIVTKNVDSSFVDYLYYRMSRYDKIVLKLEEIYDNLLMTRELIEDIRG